MIGLKRGVVELADHNPEWAVLATETIERLWRVFGSVAKDIQHVGSTAICGIKAKPIIDIAVAVDDFDVVEALISMLESEDFLFRKWSTDERMLFAVGDYSKEDGIVTHFVHIVKTDSPDWYDYVYFRDYLNANHSAAKDYEDLKIKLAGENPYDKGREKYLAGKHDFIKKMVADAFIWSKTRTETIDHYDALIDENNDPVHDPLPLKEYMDKWDGQKFIDCMRLSENQDVLEIGVGTGRLAVRICRNCNTFCGIDISPKTIEKARYNLQEFDNCSLICGDFAEQEFNKKFDVIYSSLTFIHIRDKQTVINKVSSLLKPDGRFNLSMSKSQDKYLEMNGRKVELFPASLKKMTDIFNKSELIIEEILETEFAYIIAAK
jgi:GrpB-like predicted nucleotidyltransferase (UPF0157 family)/ubiquinone/menaquinone biosynthesis C-methylase UbiE